MANLYSATNTEPSGGAVSPLNGSGNPYNSSGSSNHTWVAADTTGPRANVDADKIEALANATQAWDVNVTITLSTSTTYYVSAFMKSAEFTYGHIYWNQPSYGGVGFNLSDGSTGTPYSGSAFASGTTSIDDYGTVAYPNGWYRCWVQFTTDSTSGDTRVGVALAKGTTFASQTMTAGDLGNGIYVWGPWLDTADYVDWNDGYTTQIISDTVNTNTTITIDSADGWATPTSGNGLIAIGAGRQESGSGTVSTPPSGFTLIQSDTSGSIETYVWAKKSAGTETSIAATITGFTNFNLTCLEISATGLDMDQGTEGVLASNEEIGEVTTGSTTASTGEATLTDTAGLGLGIIGVGDYGLWDLTQSWSNSYVHQALTNSGASARAGVAIATKVLSADGATSSVLTTTDTGGYNYGAILVFGNGTPVFEPASALYSRGRRANTLLRM